MDGRARLAVGGAATVFVSVAVVCAVAVTNASALADTAGTPVAFTQIDVPLATPPPTTPAPTATPAPAISSPTTTVADPEPSPETVPAPEPEEVAPPAPVQAPTAPAPVASAPAPEQGVKSSASRGWERLIRWARSNGWTDAEIGRWFARNHGSISDWKAFWQSSETPARGAGTPSVSDQWSRDGLKKDQSPSTPSERD